jgi:hypothetical protein
MFLGPDYQGFSFVFFGFLLPLAANILRRIWTLQGFWRDLPFMGAGN